MSKNIDQKDIEKALEAAASAEAGARSTLQVDFELYQGFLDDADISEEQKRQMIEALWSIIVAFVEIGFGVHPVQEACEAADKDKIEAGNGDSDDLYLEELSKNKTNSAGGQSVPDAAME